MVEPVVAEPTELNPARVACPRAGRPDADDPAPIAHEHALGVPPVGPPGAPVVELVPLGYVYVKLQLGAKP